MSEKEHEVGHYHQLCLLLVVFVVSTLKQALKECKTFDFSVFAAVAFKRRKVDYGKNRITSSSILCI